MRAVVQRVLCASVTVDGRVVGEIGSGLLVLIGIESSDDEKQAGWLARKICGLRVFDDADGRMNQNVSDVGGALLVVSQFTLCADISKGNRPSYASAAPPEIARALYQYFVEQCRQVQGLEVKTGIFQASMLVHLVNDGPVTIWYDTESSYRTVSNLKKGTS